MCFSKLLSVTNKKFCSVLQELGVNGLAVVHEEICSSAFCNQRHTKSRKFGNSSLVMK